MLLPRTQYVTLLCLTLVSYFLMKAVIFVGYVCNVTGLFSPYTITFAVIYRGMWIVAKYTIYIISVLSCMWLYKFIYDKYSDPSETLPSARLGESGIYAFIYFILSSFLIFLIIVNFVSRSGIYILIWSIILNAMPLFAIYRILISPHVSRKGRMIFWVVALLLTCVTIIPYGSIVSTLFIKYLL